MSAGKRRCGRRGCEILERNSGGGGRGGGELAADRAKEGRPVELRIMAASVRLRILLDQPSEVLIWPSFLRTQKSHSHKGRDSSCQYEHRVFHDDKCIELDRNRNT